MDLDYSTFLETYTRAEKNNTEKALEIITPWLVNNSVNIVIILFIFTILFSYYSKHFKRVAKDDKELMEKYIFLRKKGII